MLSMPSEPVETPLVNFRRNLRARAKFLARDLINPGGGERRCFDRLV